MQNPINAPSGFAGGSLPFIHSSHSDCTAYLSSPCGFKILSAFSKVWVLKPHELDKTRAAEAVQEKEEARQEYIFGQQRRNLEEARERGSVPLDDYERPAPEVAPQEPQFDSAREMLDHYEKAATGNDNAKEPDKRLEQDRGRDYGGYER